MRITVHVSGHYDWAPVPEDVKVTEADLKAKRVKPGADGKYLMRVNRTRAPPMPPHGYSAPQGPWERQSQPPRTRLLGFSH